MTMKKYILSLPILLLGFVLFVACSDNNYTELDKGNTELKLTTNNNDLTLNEIDHASDAMELTWTSGTNYGTGNRITYSLELAESGNNFATPFTLIDNATQTYSWKVSTEQLNKLLHDTYGEKSDGMYQLDARITAHVAGLEKNIQTSQTSFSVKAYTPVTTTLFITGTASPGGADLAKAEEMTRTDNGTFTWTGKLSMGTVKFLTNQGQEVPSYNNDGKGALVLRKTTSEADNLFDVSLDHYYKVDVNLLTGSIKFTQTEGTVPAFEELYFIGNPTGWGFEKMTRDALDPYLFRYGRLMDKGGEFKFGTTSGSWENMYKATTANAPYTDTKMEFMKGFDPDNKWFIKDNEVGKAYKICVDIRDGKERMMMREFTPYPMIYLVGSAAPSGWDLGNATAMTVDATNPFVFTWKGNLVAGELKLSCDKQSDWNGAWFMPTTSNAQPTGKPEQMLFVNKSDDTFTAQYLDINVGDIDQKWNITASGGYTITLNQLTEQITIEKN